MPTRSLMADERSPGAVEKREERGPIAGFVGGSALLALGALGTLVAVWRLVGAFGHVEGKAVAPADKAKVLAAGIGEAMNALAIGIGVTVVGLVIATVSAFVLFRRRRAHET